MDPASKARVCQLRRLYVWCLPSAVVCEIRNRFRLSSLISRSSTPRRSSSYKQEDIRDESRARSSHVNKEKFLKFSLIKFQVSSARLFHLFASQKNECCSFNEDSDPKKKVVECEQNTLQSFRKVAQLSSHNLNSQLLWNEKRISALPHQQSRKRTPQHYTAAPVAVLCTRKNYLTDFYNSRACKVRQRGWEKKSEV